MTTILIVDDAVIDRNIAGACVQQTGATPVYASNGREALELIQREPIDLVLTDMQMAEMTGLELVSTITRDYPDIPVILMTAHGSEAVAVEALRAGAASYIPKKQLKQNIGEVLRNVLEVVKAAQQRDLVRQFLEVAESRFVIGYEPGCRAALIRYLRDDLESVNFCSSSQRMQICTALTEALTNAVDHGNLELDSALREREDNAYHELGDRRQTEAPYRERRVFVTSRMTPSGVTYSVRDEGPGFDVSKLPDPTDPENLTRASGRGVMLIRTFMDDVSFNDSGNEMTMVKHRSE